MPAARARVSPILGWSSVDAHPNVATGAVTGLVAVAALALLGLPPLNLHGPLHFAGIMDPLCGMTRGTRLVLRGNLARAVWFNPASPAVVLLGVAALARTTYGRCSGRWITVCWRTPIRIAVIAALIVALEVNQQLHAGRLMS